MMKRLLTVAAVVLWAGIACAQSSFKYNGLSYSSTGTTFANLSTKPPQTDGTLIYCSDCVQQPSCAGGGSGAWALHQAGVWNCNATNGTGTPFGGTANLITGTGANPVISGFSINGVKNVKAYGAVCDGTTNDATALQAALTAGATITAPPGVTCMTASTLTPVSNSQIVGNWTIKATAALIGAVVKLNGVSGVTVQGVTVDGNSANNTHGIFGIEVSNSTNSVIDGVTAQNVFGSGIAIDTSSANIEVRNSNAASCGETTNPIVGSGFSVSGPVSHVHFIKDIAHDNTLGFFTAPSNTPGQNSDDITFDGIDAHSNGTDGWQVFSAHRTGGLISNIQVTNSRAYCNGWIAGGAFPTNCTAGAFQGIAFTSPSVTGIGFNMDSPSVIGFVESNNKSYLNVWDGFDNTSQLIGTVNTNGTAVTWVSGDQFTAAAPVNSYIEINNVWYKIASVNSATSLTLASSAGVQNGVASFAADFDNAVITGNHANNNGPCSGSANGCSTFFEGYGFNDVSISSSYAGNQADNNYLVGFNLLGTSYVTLGHNSSADNNRAKGAVGWTNNSGFNVINSFGPTLTGNQSRDDTGVSQEPIGLAFGNTSNLTSSDNFHNAGGPYSITGANTGYSLTNNGQIQGTNTNDSAIAGNVGEFVFAQVASGSAVALTTATPANVTSISLTAGDWDVAGSVWFTGNAATTVNVLSGGVNTTSATLPAGPIGRTDIALPTNSVTFPNGSVVTAIPRQRFSVSTTTTVFLVAQAVFGTNTCSAFGGITARRVR